MIQVQQHDLRAVTLLPAQHTPAQVMQRPQPQLQALLLSPPQQQDQQQLHRMWTLEAAAGCNQDLKQASPAVRPAPAAVCPEHCRAARPPLRLDP
jgi:hypothetical protein